MQRLEVSGAVRLIHKSLGVKGLRQKFPKIIEAKMKEGIFHGPQITQPF